jgi:hypothetical protein
MKLMEAISPEILLMSLISCTSAAEISIRYLLCAVLYSDEVGIEFGGCCGEAAGIA